MFILNFDYSCNKKEVLLRSVSQQSKQAKTIILRRSVNENRGFGTKSEVLLRSVDQNLWFVLVPQTAFCCRGSDLQNPARGSLAIFLCKNTRFLPLALVSSRRECRFFFNLCLCFPIQNQPFYPQRLPGAPRHCRTLPDSPRLSQSLPEAHSQGISAKGSEPRDLSQGISAKGSQPRDIS